MINIKDLMQAKRTYFSRSYAFMFIILIFTALMYLIIGDIFINPFNAITDLQWQILTQLRLPRLLITMLIGASLAISGACLQVLLQNPLADPNVLGISGGASMAMALLITLFPMVSSVTYLMYSAIFGSLICIALLLTVVKIFDLSSQNILLIGISFSMGSGAIVTLSVYFSNDLNLRVLMYWLMGGVSNANWQQLNVAWLLLPTFFWLIKQARILDLLSLGEIHAAQMGINIKNMQIKLIFAIAILVGSAVALGGMISFIGLIVPHMLRFMGVDQNKYLLPLSAQMGATLLLLADFGAKNLLGSAELPLGVIATLLGVPVFIFILFKTKTYR